ncbi:MAG: BadF/BadG/BcrA/BcrD ATPase family protein [Gemmatimonadota bacterium]
MRMVVGVDGGGTNTRVIVADESGETLAGTDGGPSAVRPGRAAESAATISTVVRAALESADRAGERPAALCVGVAGVGREEERSALTEALLDADIADEVVVMADALIGLEDAFQDGPGVLVIAGTGSVAWGRGPTGAFARSGGWGPVCGDEGSGSWIGRRALSVVTAAHDGREPETALTQAILRVAGASEVSELIPWAAAAAPAQLASLVPAVFAAAKGGDLRANSIVTLAAEELVLHLRTLARQLFVDERATVPVALGGGLFARGSLLRKRFLGRTRSAVPGAVIRDGEIVPVRGAVQAALRHLAARAG